MEPATPELTKEEQKAEKQRLAAQKKADKAALIAERKRIAAEKKEAKMVQVPELTKSTQNDWLVLDSEYGLLVSPRLLC